MKTEISPCCNAEMWLQARWEGKALYQCSKCKHHAIPVGMEAYNLHQPCISYPTLMDSGGNKNKKDNRWKERQKIWMKKIGTFDAFMKSLLNQNKDE